MNGDNRTAVKVGDAVTFTAEEWPAQFMGWWALARDAHAPGWPPDPFYDVCDPRLLPPIAAAKRAPWREGNHIFATDGVMLLTMSMDHLERNVVDLVPKKTANHPKDVFGVAQRTGPFHPVPTVLPKVSAAPPVCPACFGQGLTFATDHVAGVAVHGVCRECFGYGGAPRSDEPVAVGGDFLLDRWYVVLLRKWDASVFLPMRGHVAKFTVGPVLGFVESMERT
jgi:hypothetical protein